jgi:putative transposase
MPKPFAFEPGVEYMLGGVGYRVLKGLSEDQILVKNLMTKGEVAQKIGDLHKEWHEHHLVFGLHGRNLREEEGSSVKTSYVFEDLAFLDAAFAQETWDRYQLILRLLDLHFQERTDTRIEQEIEKFVAEQLLLMASGERTHAMFPQRSGKREKKTLSDGDAVVFPLPAVEEGQECTERSASHTLASVPLLRVSARTARRWIEEYEKSREDIRSLVPAYDHRGRRGVQLLTKVVELLEQAIKEVYETEERPPVTKVIDKLKFIILAENKKRPDDQPKLVMPDKRKVYRAIGQLDPVEVDTARLGRRHARREHQQYHRGPRPTRPNQRWEEDDTLIDLFVIDADDGLPIGRPLLTVIRDKYSGVIPGLSISFEPSSARTVMECLFYAIPKKDHVRSLFELRNDYVGYGVPETLVVDRGRGYIGKDLRLACAQLGIELDPLPRKSPWLKASIERFIKENATDLIHVTPGTSFSNFLVRGDYDPAKHACVTLDGLWYLLHKWIVDVYTRDKHRGIGGVPAKLWERALERDFVPRLPASRNELAILLSRIESRVIQSTGIEFENLWYQDSRLSRLRHLLNSSQPHIPVQFKYNPGDLSRIWVLDPDKMRYLEVLAEDQEYTQGLSIWKHRLIKRYVREEMKRDIDEESLILAKEELYRLIHEEFRQGNKLGGRKKAARVLDIQVSEALRRALSPEATTAEASAISLLTDFEGSGPELREEEVNRALPNEQAEETSPLSAGEGIARLDVPLPPLVEGITLPGNEKTGAVGARLPEREQDAQKQKASKKGGSTSQTSENPPVNTDPDDDTSYGIAVSYGRSGPT